MKIKERNGITLIALVITIIVLLILAGVTIATLTGDNGLLKTASNAKEKNIEATAKEKIQVEVAGSYGLDGKIDIEQLNTNFSRINGFKYNDSALSNSNKIIALPVEIELNGYKFSVNQYGQVLSLTQADTINTKIGEVVNGYAAQGLEWQVFYADANETYLISRIIAKNNYTISLKRKKQNDTEEEYEYKGSEDVRKSIYGAKWNKTWLDKCINNESTENNAKATAYLCDPNNWEEYKTDIANYAVGGPTLDLFIASWNKSQGTSITLSSEDVTTFGTLYNKPSELFNSNPIRSTVSNGLYFSTGGYRLSTPGSRNQGLRCRWEFSISDANYTDAALGIRPIVSIPTSKINVNGDVITVNP